MKCRKTVLASLALVTLSIAASAAAQPEAIYRFEVRMPDQPEALTVRVKSGEMQTVKVAGKSWEYTSSQTTLSASFWQDLVEAGTAPDHDFVTCTKKTCTFGTKTKVVDHVNISIRPMEQAGALVATIVYDSARSKPATRFNGMRTPDVEGFGSSSSLAMKIGDLLPISEPGGVVAMVKFVGKEEEQ